MKLSIIVPCFNEEGVTELFYEESIKYIRECDCDYELILVDDGSKDNTLNDFKKLKENDNNVKIISFSRNFGKEAAMVAGLEYSSGDLVVIMDCDLQDPPKLLPKMKEIILEQGYDSVATYRVNRKGEPVIRSFFARMFYRLINKMIEVEIVDGARDYRMMTRKMVDAILSLKEYQRFSKGIFSWVGFKTKYLEFENVQRVKGETKWNFFKLFKYAIEGVVAFSTLPLRIASIFGFFISLLGFIYMIFIALKAMLYGDPVTGFPSLVVIITLLGGIELLVLGILGEYLSKTYMETKKRPRFIVKEYIE